MGLRDRPPSLLEKINYRGGGGVREVCALFCWGCHAAVFVFCTHTIAARFHPTISVAVPCVLKVCTVLARYLARFLRSVPENINSIHVARCEKKTVWADRPLKRVHSNHHPPITLAIQRDPFFSRGKPVQEPEVRAG